MEIQISVGQVLAVVMSSLAGLIGWLLRREVQNLNERIDRAEEGLHERVKKLEDVVFEVAGEVQKLIGAFHIK